MAAASQMGCGLKLALVFGLCAYSASAATWMVTVAGLGGEPDYEQRFTMLANDTDKALKASGGDRMVETLKGADATKARLTAALGKIASQAKAQDVVVLMLIGHGTFDGAEYKFNLTGPDISGTEMAILLNHIPATRQLVVAMTSASGGLTAALKKENRTIITATKTGTEKNAVLFSRYWVEALRDPEADTDKNEVVSALEAFNYAQAKTVAFFKEQKRIATEHSVLEDTQRAATFPLVRYGGATVAITDPAKKDLVAKKEDLQNKIDELKFQKDLLAPEDYRKQMSSLLLELARTQEAIDK